MLYDYTTSRRDDLGRIVSAFLSTAGYNGTSGTGDVIDTRENLVDGVVNASVLDYAGNTAITSITLTRMTEIPPYFAFGCSELKRFSAPNAVTLCANALSGKSSGGSEFVSKLRELYLPSLAEVNEEGDSHSTKLTALETADLGSVPNPHYFLRHSAGIREVRAVGAMSFYGSLNDYGKSARTKLERVEVGRPFRLYETEFKGCSSLVSVSKNYDSENGAYVRVLEGTPAENAFYGCKSLETVGSDEGVVSLSIDPGVGSDVTLLPLAPAGIFKGCAKVGKIVWKLDFDPSNEAYAIYDPSSETYTPYDPSNEACELCAESYEGCGADSEKGLHVLTPFKWKALDGVRMPSVTGLDGVFVVSAMDDGVFKDSGIVNLQIRVAGSALPGDVILANAANGCLKLKNLSLVGFAELDPSALEGCTALEDFETDAAEGSLPDITNFIAVKRLYLPVLAGGNGTEFAKLSGKPGLEDVFAPSYLGGEIGNLNASTGLKRLVANEATGFVDGFLSFATDNYTLEEIVLRNATNGGLPHQISSGTGKLRALKKLDLRRLTNIPLRFLDNVGQELEELHLEAITAIPYDLFDHKSVDNRTTLFPKLKRLFLDNVRSVYGNNEGFTRFMLSGLDEIQIGGEGFTVEIPSSYGGHKTDIFPVKIPSKLVLGPMHVVDHSEYGTYTMEHDGLGYEVPIGNTEFYDSDHNGPTNVTGLRGLNLGGPKEGETKFDYHSWIKGRYEAGGYDGRLENAFVVRFYDANTNYRCPENFLTRRRRSVTAQDETETAYGDDTPDYTLTGTLQIVGCVEFRASKNMMFGAGTEHPVNVQIIGSLGYLYYRMCLNGNRIWYPSGYYSGDRFPPPGVTVGGFAGTDVENVFVEFLGDLQAEAFMDCTSLKEFRLSMPGNDGGYVRGFQYMLETQRQVGTGSGYAQVILLSTRDGPHWNSNQDRYTGEWSEPNDTQVAMYASELLDPLGDQFNGCSSMTRCDVLAAAAHTCSNIAYTWLPGPRSFRNCASVDMLKTTPYDESLTPFYGLYDAMDEVFAGCSKLFSGCDVTMLHLVSIGPGAFRGTNFKKVSLPNCVMIDEGAFEDSGIEEVDAPCLVRIGKAAFRNTTKLTKINAPNVVQVCEEAFAGSAIAGFSSERLMRVDSRAFADSGLKTFSARDIQEGEITYTGVFISPFCNGKYPYTQNGKEGGYYGRVNPSMGGRRLESNYVMVIESPANRMTLMNHPFETRDVVFNHRWDPVTFNGKVAGETGDGLWSKSSFTMQGWNITTDGTFVYETHFDVTYEVEQLTDALGTVPQIAEDAFYGCSLDTRSTLWSSKNYGRGAKRNDTAIGEIAWNADEPLSYFTDGDDNDAIKSITGVSVHDETKRKDQTVNVKVGTVPANYGKGATGVSDLDIYADVVDDGAFPGLENLSSLKVNASSVGKGAFPDSMNVASLTIPWDRKASDIVQAPGNVLDLSLITGPNEFNDVGGRVNNVRRAPANVERGAVVGLNHVPRYYFKGSPFLGRFAISGCSGTVVVHDGAFSECGALAEFSSSNESVTRVDAGKDAFNGCASLARVGVPIGTAEDGAFSGCSSLASVKTCEDGMSTGDQAFVNDVKLVSVDGKLLTVGNSAFMNCTSLGAVEIHGNVGDCAFRDCSGLSFVRLPGYRKEIGADAFNGCRSLETVELENKSLLQTFSKIGARAFKNVKYLSMTGRVDATEVGDEAFNGCFSHVNVYIGNLTSVGKRAFKGCSSFTFENRALNPPSTVYPERLLHIGDEAFMGCVNLDIVGFGAGIDVGARAFYGCSGLNGVFYLGSVSTIGDEAFYGCTLLKSASATTGGAEYHFSGALSLTGVLEIGERAFQWCTSLTKVSFGAGLTRIGKMAFAGCTGLTSVTVPSSTEIEDGAFDSSVVVSRS